MVCAIFICIKKVARVLACAHVMACIKQTGAKLQYDTYYNK